MQRLLYLLPLTWAIVAGGSNKTGLAQTLAAPNSATGANAGTQELTIAQIDAARRTAEESTELDEAAKKNLIEIYRQCGDELKAAAEWRAKTAEFEAARLTAPQDLQQWKEHVDAPETMPVAPANATIEDLKSKLADAEAELKTARDSQTDLEGRQRRRAQRWEEVRGLDEAAGKRLEEVYKQLGALPSADKADAAGNAQRTLLLCRRQNIQSERASYAQELPSYDATRELLRLQLDDAVQRSNACDKRFNVWKDAAERQGRQLAELQAQEARRRLITTRSELLPLAAENERLTQLRSAAEGPAAKLKGIRQALPDLKRQLARIKAEFAHVRQVADLSQELGQVLVRQRRQLPDLKTLEEGLGARQEEIARAKLELFDLEDRRSLLADVEVEAQTALLPLEGALDGEERADLLPAVRELLTVRRGYLDDLIADYNAYFNALVLEYDKTDRELVQTVRLYLDYIDQRILWVPSYSPQTGLNAKDFSAAAAQFTSPRAWWSVVMRFVHDAFASPHIWAIALAVFAGFVWSLRRLRAALARLGEVVRYRMSIGMSPTVAAAVLTVVIASPAPAVLWFLASRLTAAPGADDFSRAFADAMLATAPIWATIALVRQSLRRGGLAERHFGLPKEIADSARRTIWRLAAAGLPAAAIAALFESLDPLAWQASFGRTAFCLGMVCLYRLARAVAHPTHGWAARLFGDDVDDFRLRLRRLWYFGACAPPPVLIGLSAAGYHYAALQLACRLQETIWLGLACLALRSFLSRWLAVARRRLAIRRAEQGAAVHLDATTEAAATSGPLRIAGSAEPPAPAEPEINLKSIDIQTRRLLNSFGALALLLGTWWIWTDMLPALQFLDRLQLYSYSVTEMETISRGDAAPQVVEVTRLQWITAADVAWAAIILLMTVIAARNLPGLLEITCLQWLPIDQGARYAVTAAARYVIHIVGIVAICTAVGLKWSSIQWLAAAMTVGLGFGMQEIFANFISGLIILFERPIRVGDTVTIGDVSGTVSRIRGRATTIVDWDRKELIVPNKEFITGKLINWTLTDDVLRTVIRVGIGESADFERAAQVLLQVARANALVLTDPGPSVAFTQVGDGRLDFELRVFSAGLDSLTPLRFQLNSSILRAFREAGIEIASASKEMVLRTTGQAGIVVPREVLDGAAVGKQVA